MTWDRETCEWCAHPWTHHGYPDGCVMIVGAGREVGGCPCTVTNPEHGRVLDRLEQASGKRGNAS